MKYRSFDVFDSCFYSCRSKQCSKRSDEVLLENNFVSLEIYWNLNGDKTAFKPTVMIDTSTTSPSISPKFDLQIQSPSIIAHEIPPVVWSSANLLRRSHITLTHISRNSLNSIDKLVKDKSQIVDKQPKNGSG